MPGKTDLIIQAELRYQKIQVAAKRTNKTLQILKNGTKKWETEVQTANRTLKEHARALNASAKASQKKTSFVKRMTTAFIGADIAA